MTFNQTPNFITGVKNLYVESFAERFGITDLTALLVGARLAYNEAEEDLDGCIIDGVISILEKAITLRLDYSEDYNYADELFVIESEDEDLTRVCNLADLEAFYAVFATGLAKLQEGGLDELFVAPAQLELFNIELSEAVNIFANAIKHYKNEEDGVLEQREKLDKLGHELEELKKELEGSTDNSATPEQCEKLRKIYHELEELKEELED